MRRKIWVLVLIALISACKGSKFALHSSEPLAPDPTLQASDLSAPQLLEKTLAARGGAEKLLALRSVRMTGAMETAQISSSPVTLTIAPGRYLRRTDVKGGVTLIKAVGDRTTWEVTPQIGITEPTPMVPKEAARFRRLADPQGPLVGAAAKGNKVEVLGKMPWRDATVYKMKVTFPDGGVNFLYLDAQSFLPVRLVNTMFVPQLDEDVEVEVSFEDFRDIGGVQWPFRESAHAPEVGFTQVISWQTIEPNVPIDESAFEMPKS